MKQNTANSIITGHKVSINPTDLLELIINLQLQHEHIHEFTSTEIINGARELFGTELSRHKLPQLMAAKFGPINLGFLADRTNDSTRHFYKINAPEAVLKNLLNNIEHGLYDRYKTVINMLSYAEEQNFANRNFVNSLTNAIVENKAEKTNAFKTTPISLIGVIIDLKKTNLYRDEFTAAEIIQKIKQLHGADVTPKKLWQLMTAKFGPVKLGIVNDRHTSFRHYYRLNTPLTIVRQLLTNINPQLTAQYFQFFENTELKNTMAQQKLDQAEHVERASVF